ncbi:hypothetical protein [Okeania sp. SIO1I7]|uniref:hypothetical protein n=1 Tax=Okeania sp. SIO1I7 TaxID=2607772 RepID=UPI0013F82D68|nr:hypothetical protein [Okeania sp. SIO1I7]NET27317.1 hypothetical protein [Okeania sp. SIO1I7]
MIIPTRVMALPAASYYSNSNQTYTDVDTYFLKSSILAKYTPDDNGKSGDSKKGGGAH